MTPEITGHEIIRPYPDAQSDGPNIFEVVRLRYMVGSEPHTIDVKIIASPDLRFLRGLEFVRSTDPRMDDPATDQISHERGLYLGAAWRASRGEPYVWAWN